MAEKVSGEKPAKKPGLFSRIGRFFKDLRGESKKVVWPTRKQIINNTLIVIVFMIIASLIVSGFDAILGVVRALLLQI